jgi:hypothetical protein
MGELAVAYVSVHRLGEYSPKDRGLRRRKFNIEYQDQQRRIAQFARRNSLRVLHTLCEKMDETPDDFFSRSGIQGLLGWVCWRRRSHGPGSSGPVVLVESQPRFHAPDLDLALMLLHLSRQGVRLFEVSSGKELTAEVAALESTINQADLGEMQSAEQRLRTAKWRASKKSNGRKCGPKPFGELPGEDRVLEEISRLRTKPRNQPRRSYREIAAILNEKGMPTRSGRPWQAKTIQIIICRSRPWLYDRNEAKPYWRLDFPRGSH